MNNRGCQAELPISCFRCGVCCSGYSVRANLLEAHQIADGLGLAWDEFRDKYIERHWSGTDTFLLRQNGGVCIFLEHVEGSNQTSCLIHPFKPSTCRDWTPSLHRRQCQEGLTKGWGLAVGRSGELQGSEERIERFQFFLASLVIAR